MNRFFMKFCRGVRREAKNRLDFGGDPDSFVDPGSFSKIIQHYEFTT